MLIETKFLEADHLKFPGFKNGRLWVCAGCTSSSVLGRASSGGYHVVSGYIRQDLMIWSVKCLNILKAA